MRMRPLTAIDALELGAIGQVFLDAHLRIERDAFGQIADALADLHRLRHDVEAGHAGDAAGGRQIGGQDAHDGRLAGAVVAEQADDLVLLDLETDVVDGQDGAEIFAQIFNVNHGPTVSVRLPRRATHTPVDNFFLGRRRGHCKGGQTLPIQVASRAPPMVEMKRWSGDTPGKRGP